MRLVSSCVTKMEVVLRTPEIVRCNFEIHLNDPAPLAHAIKTRMKYFEETGYRLAKKKKKNPWTG
jgi:hypothetical protein